MIKIAGLLPKQKEIINSIITSKNKFHVINASRQSGKTLSLSKLAVYFALNYSNENILIVTPSYIQTRVIFNNILRMNDIFKVILSKKISSPFEIIFNNNSVLNFRSADNIDSLRGGSYRFVILDEFGFFRNGDFDTVIRPTTSAKMNSKIVIASTPKGKESDFYNMAQLGINSTDNYSYYTMHYTDNAYYDLADVEDAQLRLPDNLFLQEYEAKFIDNNSDVFDNIENVCCLQSFPISKNSQYYCGIDFGRANDFTVITILNKDKEVVYVNKYNKMSWDEIVNNLAETLNEYKPITYCESNSIGDVLIENLRKQYKNIYPFITTNASKREIIEKLKYDITLNDIYLPNKKLYPDIYNELNTFTVKQSTSGTITYSAKESFHDDHIISLAIANYVHSKYNKKINIQKGIINDFYN